MGAFKSKLWPWPTRTLRAPPPPRRLPPRSAVCSATWKVSSTHVRCAVCPRHHARQLDQRPCLLILFSHTWALYIRRSLTPRPLQERGGLLSGRTNNLRTLRTHSCTYSRCLPRVILRPRRLFLSLPSLPVPPRPSPSLPVSPCPSPSLPIPPHTPPRAPPSRMLTETELERCSRRRPLHRSNATFAETRGSVRSQSSPTSHLLASEASALPHPCSSSAASRRR